MMAAAKGGFTTVTCMPNTVPVIDNRSIAEMVVNESRRAGMINVFPIGAITKLVFTTYLSPTHPIRSSSVTIVWVFKAP